MKDWVNHHECGAKDEAVDQLIPIDKIQQEKFDEFDTKDLSKTVEHHEEKVTKNI